MSRSWWGWGDVEEAVDAAEAAALVERVAALAPEHDFTVHEPPSPESLDIAAARTPTVLAGRTLL